MKFLQAFKKTGNAAWLWSVYLVQLAIQIPMHVTALDVHYTSSAPHVNKNNLLEYLPSHKALIIFHNNSPNSNILAFLEFLVNALSTTSHSKSAKHTCKIHNGSPENCFYLLLNNLIWLLIAVVSRYNTNLKLPNTKLV